VAGDGKVYAASVRGVVTVLAAGDVFRVLARNDLQDAIVATPALFDGKIYLRTKKYLYAFAE
jgi:outer membrane protein assembly factor BamB